MTKKPAVATFTIFAILAVYGIHLVLTSPGITLRVHGMAFMVFGIFGAIVGAAVALDRT